MKTMEHKPEFPARPANMSVDGEWMGDRTRQREEAAKETAGAYSRIFGSQDGKKVMADLMAKFDPERPRFHNHSDAIQAARIDGQSDVLREIRRAIKAGQPITGIPD